MKKIIWLIFKISVTAGCFAWIFLKFSKDEAGNIHVTGKIPFTGEHGIFTILANSDKPILASFVILYLATVFLIAFRFQLLLKVQKINIGFAEAARLTFLGHFFNNFMPGLVGGDIVKAYYAAKQTHRKGHAAATVLLDRIAGMVAMAIIAAVMITWRLSGENFREYGWYIYLFIGVFAAMTIVFFSRRLRKLLRYEKMLQLVPFQGLKNFLHQADEAFFIYRFNKKTLLLVLLISFVVHAIAVALNYGLGLSFGVRDVSFFDYYLFVPVILMIIAVPITVGGWGLRETLYVKFFGSVGVGSAVAISISALFRLTEMLWSLPGSYFYLARRERVSVEEMEEEVEAESQAPLQDEATDD